MKYKLIAAKDMQLGVFMPIQSVNDISDEDIIESNRRGVVQGKIPAPLAAHLVIYKLGTFDDKTGNINLLSQPEELVSLADFLPKEVKPAGEPVNA